MARGTEVRLGTLVLVWPGGRGVAHQRPVLTAGSGAWLLGQLMGLDSHGGWEKGKKQVGTGLCREKREGGS
jgi:hypothetical protein